MYVILLLCFVGVFGAVVKRNNLIPEGVRSALYKYVYFVASPIAVVHALLDRTNTHYSSYFTFLMLNTTIYFGLFLAILFAASRTNYKKKIVGVIAYTSNTPNTIFIGFPLVLALFHQETFIYAVVLGTLMDALLNSLRIAVIGELGIKKQSRFKLIIKSILNPFLIALLSGLALSFASITFSPLVMEILGVIAKSTSYVALFVLGVTVGTLKLKSSYKKYYLQISIGKLIVLPLCVLAGSSLLGLNETARNAGVFISALPSAVFSLIVAANLKLDEELAAGAILVTTCLSVFTLPFWYILLTKL